MLVWVNCAKVNVDCNPQIDQLYSTPTNDASLYIARKPANFFLTKELFCDPKHVPDNVSHTLKYDCDLAAYQLLALPTYSLIRSRLYKAFRKYEPLS